MLQSLDECILAVEANPIADSNRLRLKYVAISGGCGPEIEMDRDMAEVTIKALQAALAGERYDSWKEPVSS